MALAQKVFDRIPDWLKVRIFELTEDEKWFLETERELRGKTMIGLRGYTLQDVEECDELKADMEFIVNNRQVRFMKYFSEKIREAEDNISIMLGY